MNTIVRRIVLLVMVGAFAGAPALAAPANSTVDIVASNWKFTPNTIQLHVGQMTTLRLTSSEGVHGLQSDDLGIALTTISPGTFTTVSVTPKKAGKYVVHCAIMCGAGHPNMALTINVVP